MSIRSALTPYDPMDYSQPAGEKPTRTQQQFKDSCDINQILARYQSTGVIDHVKKHGGNYGDHNALDFQESLQIITRAESMFAELPSKAREYFKNDPAKFLDFTSKLKTDDVETLIDLELLERGSETHETWLKAKSELDKAPKPETKEKDQPAEPGEPS